MEPEDDAPRTASEAKRLLATEESTSNPPFSSHRRSVSGTGLLSKLPFMKPNPVESKARHGPSVDEHDLAPPSLSTTSPPPAQQQQQQRQASRRRRGSLRKVALLGRGAQRERRDSKQLSVDTAHQASLDAVAAGHDAVALATKPDHTQYDALGLPTSEIAPQTQPDGSASESSLASSSISSNNLPQALDSEPTDVAVAPSYNSTTDEEDVLQIPGSDNSPDRPKMPPSSGSESYFGHRAALQPLRRTSVLRAKSPLSYSGLASTPMPAAEADVDYAETEWWGWVVLIVTWVVFVVGMGSCLGTWSWAWDVGTTPYAPPELEDDPTLPIVGYYPALIILTCIMAWVWVVVAWVGMKYFRHAKISGD